MAIKTVIFDLGNTVINFNHAVAVKRILSYTDRTFQDILDLFFDSSITEKFETGKISKKEFYCEVKYMLNLTLGYDEFVSIWNDIFFHNEASENLVRNLKSKYRLICLSNINVLHLEFVKKHFDILKVFDEIIASCEVGYRKPDKRIYDVALEKSECNKDELIYTDDREDLIEFTKSLGIKSFLFQDAEHLMNYLSSFGVKVSKEK